MNVAYFTFEKGCEEIIQEILASITDSDEFKWLVTRTDISDFTRGKFQHIRESDVCIIVVGCEISVNASLEIGFALGSSKKVAIVLSPSATPIPRSLATFPIFVARSDSRWIEDLVEFIKTAPETRAPEGFRRINSAREQLSNLAQSTELLDQLSESNFEDLIADYFEEMPQARLIRVRRSDRNCDLRVHFPDEDLWIAVKVRKVPSQTCIGIGEVVDLAEVHAGRNTHLLYITTGKFTDSALDFARTTPIALWLFTLGEFIGIPQLEFVTTLKRRALQGQAD